MTVTATLTIEPGAVDPATHRNLPAGRYWACTRPERPADVTTSWGMGCVACLIHSVAVLVNEPDGAQRPVQYQASAQSPVVNIVFVDLMALLADATDNEILTRRVGNLGGDLDRAREACGLA